MIEVLSSLADVDPAEWDALDHGDNPFTEYAFLRLLETSGSVGPRTGWTPSYVVLREGGRLVGAVPAYEKSDSYGEYIFDWAFAEAAARARMRYYPKLVAAVPFTPATGGRLLCSPGLDRRAELIEGLLELHRARQTSSVHVLFCRLAEAEALERFGFARRRTHQYHFENPGYASFEDFLSALRSEVRKQIKKERRRIAEQGVEVVQKVGEEITAEDWAALDRLYRVTGSQKWGRPYLTKAFFSGAKDTIGPRALAVFGRRQGQIIAGTLSFFKGAELFGRYWGATEAVDGLHFELCYYQLLDRAIAARMRRVEAGAQGEHKIKRGFLPAPIESAHFFEAKPLHRAAAEAFAAERADLERLLPEWQGEGPYKRG
ncbi:MAG: peptidogalycan biosysnthesis protein [Myxococcota bacterium]